MSQEQGLYLGKIVNPGTGEPGACLVIDSSDLLTHGLIVGMTGSGKTGLGCVLIEEVLRRGIPVLAIDPKGDLGNLQLLFETWEGTRLTPWIDPETARREGMSVDELAAKTADAWRSGWNEWGLGSADARELKRAREAVIFTPGSKAGVPLNVMRSLAAPGVPFETMEEELRDEIASLVRGLLRLAEFDQESLQSTPSVFLSNLIERSWRDGRDMTLESLITAVADPPFDKIGALSLERVYPRKDREKLLIALNNVLAAPAFESWRTGESLDMDRLLRAADGRPRLSIVSTAHLPEEERFFVTALLLDRVKTWMRRQSGTSALRALVYMDEIFGYFPPHPANPPTKRPLLTLLKQARAQGVGVVLATQNTVDIDYKGLSNMGIWLVGKLQTEQDRERLKDGLVDTAANMTEVERLLAATRKRVFLLHDVHRGNPDLFHTRWTLSFLRGPLTRDQISRLKSESFGAEAAEAPAREHAKPAGGVTASSGATVPSAAPLLPASLRHHYLDRHGGEVAEAYVFVKFAVNYRGVGERVSLRAYPLRGASPSEALDAPPLEFDEESLGDDAPPQIRYTDLPEYMQAQGAKGLERALRERLPDKLAVTVFVDPWTKATSLAGEDRESFAGRLRANADDPRREKLADKIAEKKQDLEARERDLSGRRTEKWVAIGTALLSNVGLFGGRKKKITGAGSVLTKNRMENTAEARVESLKAEIANLEQDLARLAEIDPARFEERLIAPSRGGVKLIRYDVVWIF